MAIVVAVMYFQNQQRRMWHETARLALEKGQPVPVELLPGNEAREKGAKPTAVRRDLKAGLILIAVAAHVFRIERGWRHEACLDRGLLSRIHRRGAFGKRSDHRVDLAEVGRPAYACSVSLPDSELITRAMLEDDRDAFGELVRRHQSAVRRFWRHLAGGDFAWADDLAQETFVSAHRNLRSFRGRATFLTWLLGIAHNHFRNARRRLCASRWNPTLMKSTNWRHHLRAWSRFSKTWPRRSAS